MGVGVIPAGLQRLGRHADHLTQSHAVVENKGSYASPPPRHTLGVNADNCLEECLFHAVKKRPGGLDTEVC